MSETVAYDIYSNVGATLLTLVWVVQTGNSPTNISVIQYLIII